MGGAVDLPGWVEQLWAELRFRELVGQTSGEGFQRLFQQVMKAVDGDDFVEVRPVGKHGDFTCDGWGLRSQTCYAVYGPWSAKSRAQVRRKIEIDFFGAVAAWPDMKTWRFVHNDYAGLNVLALKALTELTGRIEEDAPHVRILPPWGPRDLWWLFRQAPEAVRGSLLGTQGWTLNHGRLDRFVGAGGEPVSVAASQSVAQLLDGFVGGGIVDPLTATAFAGALAMFLLGDDDTFQQQSSLLEQRCRDDPFEAMLTSIVFCVTAVRLWEAATGDPPQVWADMLAASGSTVPYVTNAVLSARSGVEPDAQLPGHAVDQRKITMNLGNVTALTLQLLADCRADPVVVVLQDLLIGVQRERPAPTVDVLA